MEGVNTFAIFKVKISEQVRGEEPGALHYPRVVFCKAVPLWQCCVLQMLRAACMLMLRWFHL